MLNHRPLSKKLKTHRGHPPSSCGLWNFDNFFRKTAALVNASCLLLNCPLGACELGALGSQSSGWGELYSPDPCRFIFGHVKGGLIGETLAAVPPALALKPHNSDSSIWL